VRDGLEHFGWSHILSIFNRRQSSDLHPSGETPAGVSLGDVGLRPDRMELIYTFSFSPNWKRWPDPWMHVGHSMTAFATARYYEILIGLLRSRAQYFFD
jgi:hypothetical protein